MPVKTYAKGRPFIHFVRKSQVIILDIVLKGCILVPVEDIQIGLVLPDQRKGRVDQESVKEQLVVKGALDLEFSRGLLSVGALLTKDQTKDHNASQRFCYVFAEFHRVVF